MTSYGRVQAAERAGVEPSYIDRLVKLGILAPAEPERFSSGDVRRVLMARSLDDAGMPLDVWATPSGVVLCRSTSSMRPPMSGSPRLPTRRSSR